MTEYPTRTRWLMVALLFCTYVLTSIDRVNISIAAKYIMPEYGLSDMQVGWIFSAFVLGYAIFQVPCGWLGDRFGPRRVLAVAICWWSVFTAVTAVAGELFLTALLGVVGSFAVVRVLIGLGEAVVPPTNARVVANWVAPGERGLAMGIIASGSALGLALTPPLVVWIMVTLGWREAFYLFSGVGIVFAFVWYGLARDRPAEHPWVNTAELRYIAQTSAPPPVPSQALGPPPWRVILGSRNLWFLAAVSFVVGYVSYIYISWFYLYLVNVSGFSILSGGVYSTLPFLAAALAVPIGGWLSDCWSRRFGKRIGRCGLGCGSLLFAAGSIFAGAAAEDPYLAILFLSLGAGFLFLNVTLYFITTIDLTKTYAGTVGGFIGMSTTLGGALSPTLTPFLAQHLGWEGALYVAAALALLGAFFWLGVHPERAIDLGEEAPVLPHQGLAKEAGGGQAQLFL